MPPSEEEKQFAKRRFAIQDAVCACFTTAELCLGLHCVSMQGKVDSLVGPILGNTLSGQILTQYRTYRHDDGNEFKIEIAIGHTGNWQAIVTVTSSLSDPRQVIYESDDGRETNQLIAIMVEELKAAP